MANPLVKICRKTVRHFRHVLRDTQQDYMRIGVSGGGCNGLRYTITPSSSTLEKHDAELNCAGVRVVVCGRSLFHLVGSELTWTTDVMGSRIEFSNPNAASSCGCGETFSV